MLLGLAVAALAGVTGKVDGKPFEAKAALGMPGQPGQVIVVLLDVPAQCGAAAGKEARGLTIAFDARSGATATGALSMTPKALLGAATAEATLDAMPAGVGETGRVSVASYTGRKTAVSGDVEFVLCEAIVPDVAPTATFTDREVSLDEPAPIVFLAPIPDWASQTDWAGRTIYVAPDRVTKFWIDATCDGGCGPDQWASNAEAHAETMIGAFVGVKGWQHRVWEDESPSPGVRVTRYGFGAEGQPMIMQLDVVMWGADWPAMGICHAETMEKYAGFIDEAEKACLRMVRVR